MKIDRFSLARFWFPCLFGLVLLSAIVSQAHAQRADRKGKKETPPEPETVSLETKDGVQLKCTFYGSLLGKKAVPIMIVHDFNGNRNEYDRLATSLQARGHAVLTIDLRGHGESTKFHIPGTMREGTLSAKQLRRGHIVRMFGVGGDLETAKSFLMKKNNAGELNIQRLCVIGTGAGAVVALNWSALDWSWPPLTTGKQGQDVHGLVLISPEWNFRGVQVRAALNHPGVRSQISMLLICGERGKAAGVTEQIFNAVKNFHPDPPPDEVAEKKSLFLRQLDTSLQGAKLLNKTLNVPTLIADFIDLRLVQKDFSWSERRNP